MSDQPSVDDRDYWFRRHEILMSQVAAAVEVEREATKQEIIEYLEGVAERCGMVGRAEAYQDRGAYIRSLIDPHIRSIRASGPSDALAAALRQAEARGMREALGGMSPESAATCLNLTANELRGRGYEESANLHARIAAVIAAAEAKGKNDGE